MLGLCLLQFCLFGFYTRLDGLFLPCCFGLDPGPSLQILGFGVLYLFLEELLQFLSLLLQVG